MTYRKPSDFQGKGQGAEKARKIADIIGKIPHVCYVEPFVGRGDVFRAMPRASVEILNDKDCGRLKETVQKSCPIKKAKGCERIKRAKRSCGRDWKTFLRYDSKATLFYLDPPWLGVPMNGMRYRMNKPILAEEMYERTKGLKGAVAISYKDEPQFARVLCKRPFACKRIKQAIFKHSFTQLLAVKKPS